MVKDHGLRVPRVLWMRLSTIIDEEQIRSCILTSINNYRAYNAKEPLECIEMVVKIISNTMGYVFIKDITIYNLLAGFNEDGSERVQVIDVSDDEDTGRWDAPCVKYVELPPLVELVPYKLKESQLSSVISKDELFTFTLETAKIYYDGDPDFRKINFVVTETDAFTMNSLKSELIHFLRCSTISAKKYPHISIKKVFRMNSGKKTKVPLRYDINVTFNDETEGMISYRMLKNTKVTTDKGEYTLKVFVAS